MVHGAWFRMAQCDHTPTPQASRHWGMKAMSASS
jgi:hypothetical protein